MTIAPTYWAGNTRTAGESPGVISAAYNGMQYERLAILGNKTAEETLLQSRHVTYNFGTAQCICSQCNSAEWVLGEAEPCQEKTANILCGQCKPGKHRKLTGTVSTDHDRTIKLCSFKQASLVSLVGKKLI